MKIGEASLASGASPRALHLYEEEGLIEPGRFGNGYRDYCSATIERVRAIWSLPPPHATSTTQTRGCPVDKGRPTSARHRAGEGASNASFTPTAPRSVPVTHFCQRTH
jgi:hypothetical protein